MGILVMIRREKLLTLGIALTLASMTLPERGFPQADGDPVVVGTYRVIHSEILGEDRVLQIHLPRGYQESKLRYPVVYLFYSDWVPGYFAQVVNDLYHLGMTQIPPVLLVGIPNVQRYRDFIPWRSEDRPEAGEASTFLRALREEIIPFVEEEYRTQPYRIMIGPQAAGIFGAYALLEEPGIFQAFILNDPCQRESPEHPLCTRVAELAASPSDRPIFFAVGHDAVPGTGATEGLLALQRELRARAQDGFRWRIDLISDWPYFLPPVMAREALRDLFSDYPFPSPSEVAGLSEIRGHYESVSNQLGFSMDPPNVVLVQAAVGLEERGEYQEALAVLNHLVELYPFALDGPWQLANLHRMMGDTATATAFYEECLRRDPNMAPARQWLDRLRGG